jgi:hypothetical protein
MPKAIRTVDVVANGTTSQVPLIVDRNASNEEAIARSLVYDGNLVSLTNPLPIARVPRTLAATNYATATNASAIVTYAAVAGQSNVISGIAFSYSGTPVGGSLTIADGATTVFSIDVISGGAGFIPFNPPVRGTTNTALTITLSGGGAGVVGKVSVLGRWTEV